MARPLTRAATPRGRVFAVGAAVVAGQHPCVLLVGAARVLRAFAATALEQDQLPALEDPDRLAFELHAILLGTDAKFVLHDDPAILDVASQVVRQRLGLDNGRNADGTDGTGGTGAPEALG